MWYIETASRLLLAFRTGNDGGGGKTRPNPIQVYLQKGLFNLGFARK